MPLAISGPSTAPGHTRIGLDASEPGATWSQTAGPTVPREPAGNGIIFTTPSTLDGTSLAFQATTTPPPIALPSVGFEDSDPWNEWIASGLTKTFGAAYKRSGNVGMRLTAATAMPWGDVLTSNPTILKPGQSYRFEVWVQPRQLRGATWSVIAVYQVAGVTTVVQGTKYTANSTAWAQGSVTFSVPANATNVRVGFGIVAGQTAGGTAEVWLDDHTIVNTSAETATATHTVAVARHAPQIRTSSGWQMRRIHPEPRVPHRQFRQVVALASLLHEPGKLLVGATDTDANLDDPVNQATIQAIAERYDVVIGQDAWWTPVPLAVMNAIKAAATGMGRDVKILRYMDACYIRQTDTSGSLGLLPPSRATSDPSWFLHNPDGSLKQGSHGGAPTWFFNVGSTAMRTAAVAHLQAAVASGPWDGIFLDDCVYTVDGLQVTLGQDCIELPWTTDRSGTGFKSTSTIYEAAMTATVKHVSDALSAAGMLVMANISVELVDGRDFASDLAASANNAVPYQELFATMWQGQKITRPADPEVYHWEWTENHMPVRARIKAWEAAGRTYVVNGHASDPAILRYSLAAFLQWWDGSGLWCGAMDDGTGYNSMPPWLPTEYARASLLGAGSPAASETVSTGIVTRKFLSGDTVTWNPVSGTWAWTTP